MKATFFSIVMVICAGFVACQKDGMMNNDFYVDINKYNVQLKSDYNSALLNHNLLISTSKSSNASHYRTLYHQNDSSFSAHFYNFSIDMMQNSGMMSGSNGMMGTNYGMMSGSGGIMGLSMMNGSAMGSNIDLKKMISYMDSIHYADITFMNPDFFKSDSLMFYQMSLCKMMVSSTDSITNIYNKMQLLRKKHRATN